MSLSDRLRDLDNNVLGRSVPDERPLTQRLLKPRPAVWSPKGRVLYGIVLLGMAAVLWLGSDSALGAFALVPLVAAAFMVVAADERKRAKRFHHGEDSDERG